MSLDIKSLNSDQLFEKLREPEIRVKGKPISFKPIPRYQVRLRPWEYRIYKIYDGLIDLTGSIWPKINGVIKVWLYRLSLHPWFRIEYFLDYDTNTIKIRRYQGAQGVYKQINGKLAKIGADPGSLEMNVDFTYALASEIAHNNLDKKQKAKVKDAEFFALSHMKSRYMPKSGEELDWEARENARS